MLGIFLSKALHTDIIQSGTGVCLSAHTEYDFPVYFLFAHHFSPTSGTYSFTGGKQKISMSVSHILFTHWHFNGFLPDHAATMVTGLWKCLIIQRIYPSSPFPSKEHNSYQAYFLFGENESISCYMYCLLISFDTDLSQCSIS